jgi:hypothetical protein
MEISMRSTILIAAALVLFSSAVMAQSTDTTSPPTTGPAAQSDSMSKRRYVKGQSEQEKDDQVGKDEENPRQDVTSALAIEIPGRTSPAAPRDRALARCSDHYRKRRKAGAA